MRTPNLSIGKINLEGLGYTLMKLGLALVKPKLQNNVYWALEAAINDSQLSNSIKDRYTVSADELKNLISSKCKSTSVWCWDSKYYYTTLDDFKRIINEDTLNRMKWIAEYHDCDNFATEFSAYIDIFFQLNSVGIAIGAVSDKSGKVIGYHAWNCIIIRENTNTELYFYEPQNDTLNKVTGCSVNMGWANYTPEVIIFK